MLWWVQTKAPPWSSAAATTLFVHWASFNTIGWFASSQLCTQKWFYALESYSKQNGDFRRFRWAICLKWFLCSERTINDSVQPLFCFQTILRTNCWKVFWTFCWLRKVLSVNFRIVWERLSLDKTPNKFNCLLPTCTQIFKWTCKQADFKKYQMHPVL